MQYFSFYEFLSRVRLLMDQELEYCHNCFRFFIVVMLIINTGLSILIREENPFAMQKIESSNRFTQRQVYTSIESILLEAKEARQRMDLKDDDFSQRKFWTQLRS